MSSTAAPLIHQQDITAGNSNSDAAAPSSEHNTTEEPPQQQQQPPSADAVAKRRVTIGGSTTSIFSTSNQAEPPEGINHANDNIGLAGTKASSFYDEQPHHDSLQHQQHQPFMNDGIQQQMQIQQHHSHTDDGMRPPSQQQSLTGGVQFLQQQQQSHMGGGMHQLQQHQMINSSGSLSNMTMQMQPTGMGMNETFGRRGSMASFGGIDEFFGRRPSLGFDMGMDNFFGRRDSMDSATIDAAIMDISRRRFSTAPDLSFGSIPSMAAAPAGSLANCSQNSHESIAARQLQLQQQQRELEQRQKELEFQRQQLIASMQERSYGGMNMDRSISGTNGSLALGSVGSSSQNGVGSYARQPSGTWIICQFCNKQAFASHDEAMAHEAICMDVSGRGIKSGMTDTMHPLPMHHHESYLGSTGRSFSIGLGGLMDTSGRSMSMGLGTVMDNSARGVVSMGMDSSRGAGSMGLDSSRNMSFSGGMDSSMNSSSHGHNGERLTSMSMGPFAMLQQPMPLSMPSDKDWLTPLHCFVRRHCVEVFTASDSEVATPSKGKRKPIHVGQIGIRCPHCHSLDGSDKERERGSVYYPTTISSIYNATMNLLQRHLHNCPAVPDDIMRRYETLKADDARSGTSKRYWIESALSLGLVDTPNGIRHSALRPPPLPSLTRQQESTGTRRNSNEFFTTKSNAEIHNQDDHDHVDNGEVDDNDHSHEEHGEQVDKGEIKEQPSGNCIYNQHDSAEHEMTESSPLVTPEDKPYATVFSYQLLGQMQPCVFTEADRLGKRKGLPPGFPGLACRHCFGGYGSGRFFPSSIKTLSDTSKTLNVLHNHMMRCRKCPADVKESLESLRNSHDEQRAKMKFGSQKAFFARIWERLHGKDTPSSFKRVCAPQVRPLQHEQDLQIQMRHHHQIQMQQQLQQQQIQQQQQQQYHMSFNPGYAMSQQMNKGGLDVLADVSSPSKRHKSG